MRKARGKAGTARGARRPSIERWILAAGLAGSIALAACWDTLSAWFVLPLILSLALFGVGFSVRRLKGRLSVAEDTQGSLVDEIRTLSAESERRIRELRALYESSLVVSRATESANLVAGLAEDARQLSGAEVGCVFLVEGDRLEEIHQAGSGDRAGFRIERDREIPADGLVRRLIDGGMPLVVSDTRRERDAGAAPELKEGHLRSLVAVPLTSGGRVIGGVFLGASEPGFFTGEEVRLLTILGNPVSAAVEKLKFSRELSGKVGELEAENEDLRRLGRLKGRVVDALSREIQQPIEAVGRFASILGSALGIPGTRLRRPLADAITRETARALGIAHELEALGSWELAPARQRWRLESIGRVLRDVLVDHAASAVRRGVLLQPPESAREVVAPCDPELLREALGFLLESLVSGVREGTVLAVDLEETDGVVEISLSGEGSASFIEGLYRGTDRTLSPEVADENDPGHRYLGRAIVRSAVDLHGGTLEVRPRAKGAFQVSISLPVGRGVRPIPPEVVRALSAHAEIRGLLRTAMALVANVLGVRGVALLLLDSEERSLFVQAAHGEDGADLERVRIPVDGSIAGRAVATGEATLASGGENRRSGSSPGFERAIRAAAPLRWGRETIGVLAAKEKTDGSDFGESDLELVRHLSSLLARSLVRGKDVESVRRDLAEAVVAVASVAGRPAEGVASVGESSGGALEEREGSPC